MIAIIKIRHLEYLHVRYLTLPINLRSVIHPGVPVKDLGPTCGAKLPRAYNVGDVGLTWIYSTTILGRPAVPTSQ